ncbi:Uncharacterised protein [Pseudomonas fluorescens]|uniref:Uncharacterized protein n=1 Tax=Pseudomonas fluorescens TaxID=294 RepID=A0A379IGE6_PSEFL|nr:Uncharacterised protein [Pseudomonas fluorescens]
MSCCLRCVACCGLFLEGGPAEISATGVLTYSNHHLKKAAIRERSIINCVRPGFPSFGWQSSIHHQQRIVFGVFRGRRPASASPQSFKAHVVDECAQSSVVGVALSHGLSPNLHKWIRRHLSAVQPGPHPGSAGYGCGSAACPQAEWFSYPDRHSHGGHLSLQCRLDRFESRCDKSNKLPVIFALDCSDRKAIQMVSARAATAAMIFAASH